MSKHTSRTQTQQVILSYNSFRNAVIQKEWQKNLKVCFFPHGFVNRIKVLSTHTHYPHTSPRWDEEDRKLIDEGSHSTRINEFKSINCPKSSSTGIFDIFLPPLRVFFFADVIKWIEFQYFFIHEGGRRKCVCGGKKNRTIFYSVCHFAQKIPTTHHVDRKHGDF